MESAHRSKLEVRRREMSLAAGEQTMHVDVYNVDDTLATMLFYHGNITFAEFYGNVLEELASRGYRVLAPDRIGMGRSSGDRGAFTAQGLWDQANALMSYAAEHHEPPFITMGHSVGGTIAYEHMLAEPRVTACVANGIRHPKSDPTRLRDRIELALFKLSAHVMPSYQVDTLGMVGKEIESMSEPDRVCLKRILAYEGPEEMAPFFTMGSLAAYIDFRAPGDHAKLDRPLLLLVGDLDTEQEMVLARDAADRIDGPVTLTTVPGAGHFILETDYERAAQIVDDWVRDEVL